MNIISKNEQIQEMCDPKKYDIIDFVSVQQHVEGAGEPISIENFRRHKKPTGY